MLASHLNAKSVIFVMRTRLETSAKPSRHLSSFDGFNYPTIFIVVSCVFRGLSQRGVGSIVDVSNTETNFINRQDTGQMSSVMDQPENKSVETVEKNQKKKNIPRGRNCRDGCKQIGETLKSHSLSVLN